LASPSDGDDSAHPIASLTVGALLFVATIAAVVLWRRFSTQRPVDFDHLA